MVDLSLEVLEGPVKGMVVTSTRPTTTGVIVLAGSSGRVDVDRARLFAQRGTKALALQWFGGEDQPPGICEIPLETFCAAIDYLVMAGCSRIVLVGTSKGAEAALLVASVDKRVDVVVAMSPTSVVWGNIGPGLDGVAWPERSSWTYCAMPLDFVPADPTWTPVYRDGLISYRGLFEHCLDEYAEATQKARIPLEQATAELVIVAGGDDALWPSDWFARRLEEGCREVGRKVLLIEDQKAGHRILLPGETTPRSTRHAHGGNDEADARLGDAAWASIVKLL